MAAKPGGSGEQFEKAKPAVEQEFKLDLADYRSAEKFHPGDVQSSGQRLQDAALAYEKTMAQEPNVLQMVNDIKNGTPGTKEWDALMVKVEQQMKDNITQARMVSSDITKSTAMLGKVQTTEQHLPGNFTLSMDT